MKKRTAKAAAPSVEPGAAPAQQERTPPPVLAEGIAKANAAAPAVAATVLQHPKANLARKLEATAMREAELVRSIFHATAAEGTTREELEHPPFWTHHARKLKPGFRIEVTEASGKWWAELYVHQADAISARCEVMRFHEFSPPTLQEIEAAAASNFRVEYAGATALWRVVRKADRYVVRDKFQDRVSAQHWADDYEKTLARAAG